jgi:hypothetical protein
MDTIKLDGIQYKGLISRKEENRNGSVLEKIVQEFSRDMHTVINRLQSIVKQEEEIQDDYEQYS